MKLTKAKLINIKSYYPEQEISFEDNFNIFVGPNSGGKSNLFEIIQGSLNNIIFKHINIVENPDFRSVSSASHGKNFLIKFDLIDIDNLKKNVLDSHFMHSNDPSSLELTFFITVEDIELIEEIIGSKTRIQELLSRSMGEVEILNKIIEDLGDQEFHEFVGKELVLVVDPQQPVNDLVVKNIDSFDESKRALVIKLLALIQHMNVFYELSSLIPSLMIYPVVRYFGPHRALTQPPDSQYINLSSVGNFEENFSKNIHRSKDDVVSFVSSSYQKICILYSEEKFGLIEKYKKYLHQYLKTDFIITRVTEFSRKFEYKLEYKRTDGNPMRLSSGEKEFFNLISGLILTGIKNGLVLIDEPELHLHSQWQEVIFSLVEELSTEFGIQFFIVTHSPKFINQKTLPSTYRVYMDHDSSSHIIKPKNPLESTDEKDLINFLNTTNNEKAFFAQKVILVEGISDLIFYSEIVKQIKKEKNSDVSIEIIDAQSKNNMFRLRNFLGQWEIENFIIGDLDFIKEIREHYNSENQDSSIKDTFNQCSTELNVFFSQSKSKVRNILCSKVSRDSLSLVDQIMRKDQMSSQEFNQDMNNLINYIIQERALDINSNIKISRILNDLLDKIAIQDGILVIKDGSLENIFPNKIKQSDNKIKDAIEASQMITLEKIPGYLKELLSRVL